MPEYRAPGVYVEEVDTGIKPIEGVSTSVAGFVGMTRRGPLAAGPPLLVTSFAEFERQFGGFVDFKFGVTVVPAPLPFAVDGFFANGGKQLFIKRVMGGGAVKASKQTTGGMITRLQPGTVVNVGDTKLHVVSLRGITATTKLQLLMDKHGVITQSAILTVSSVDAIHNEITIPALTAAPAGGFEAQYTTVLTDVDALTVDAGTPVRVIGLPSALVGGPGTGPSSFIIEAKDEGSWGNGLVITAAHQNGARAEVDDVASSVGPDDALVLKVQSVAGFYANAWVEIDRGAEKRYRRVKAVLGDALLLEGASLIAGEFAPQGVPKTFVTVCEFRLTATFEGVTETYDHLTLENVPGHYYVDRIAGSTLIAVSTLPAGAPTHPFAFPSPANGSQIILDTTIGTDGSAVPTATDFVGAAGTKNGIRALEDIDEISIIAAPGLTDLLVQNALIEQCERLKDRFAILDPQPNLTAAQIRTQRDQFDTKYAALYYPRLMMTNPVSNLDIAVPPSGHMAGIYARVDTERGVHKAPANEVVRDILGYETIVNKETQELLNPGPANINVFRDFRADGRGLRIWGARCITSDAAWKYINVRRLFIFLEESLDEGTQFVVFEPNDEKLWARVTQTIRQFLIRVWRDGALMGTKEEQAFFVRCDRSTMTQDDLDNGRLIVLIGVAPVKPAEFVIIRIGQFTASAQNQ